MKITRKRVLFFDDEPGTGRRLIESLKKHGYEVVLPQSSAQIQSLLEGNHVGLIVHAAHKTETHTAMCQEFLDRFPFIPSIHLCTGPHSKEHAPLTNQWRRSLRHLCPEKEFIKVVRRLMFTGDLIIEKKLLEEQLHLLGRAELVMECTDTKEIKKKIAEFFAAEFRSENAMFLDKEVLNFFKTGAWKVIRMRAEDGTENEVKPFEVFSARPFNEQELISILGKAKDDSFVLLPHKELGHVLIVRPGKQIRHLAVFDEVIQRFCRHLEQMSQLSSAKDLTYMDDLTELYNQRYLSMVLDKEIGRSQRSHAQFSILFMDIDHFKQVNDTRGHVIGSKVLVEVAKVLKKNVRSMDYAFRYGGDEFLVLLVGADPQTAEKVAERIRSQIEAATFEVDKHELKVTLSIGVATYPDHAVSKDHIIELADKAMYCGKQKSRNVVFVAS